MKYYFLITASLLSCYAMEGRREKPYTDFKEFIKDRDEYNKYDYSRSQESRSKEYMNKHESQEELSFKKTYAGKICAAFELAKEFYHFSIVKNALNKIKDKIIDQGIIIKKLGIIENIKAEERAHSLRLLMEIAIIQDINLGENLRRVFMPYLEDFISISYPRSVLSIYVKRFGNFIDPKELAEMIQKNVTNCDLVREILNYAQVTGINFPNFNDPLEYALIIGVRTCRSTQILEHLVIFAREHQIPIEQKLLSRILKETIYELGRNIQENVTTIDLMREILGYARVTNSNFLNFDDLLRYVVGIAVEDGYLTQTLEYLVIFAIERQIPIEGELLAQITALNGELAQGLNTHSASNPGEETEALLNELEAQLNCKFNTTAAKMLDPMEVVATAHEILEEVLSENGYLKEILKTFAETNLSDGLSQKTISYAQFLLTIFSKEENLEESRVIRHLVFKHLLENCIANIVNNWTLKEQEALELWLEGVPVLGMKRHVNPFVHKDSCKPGAENRTRELAGKLMSIQSFKPEEREPIYTNRVVGTCRNFLDKAFDLELFLYEKGNIFTVEQLEEEARIYLNNLMPKACNAEHLSVVLESVELEKKTRIQEIYPSQMKRSGKYL